MTERDEALRLEAKTFARLVFDSFIYQSSESLPKEKPRLVGGPFSMATFEEAEESREDIAKWEHDHWDAENRIDPIIKKARGLYKMCADSDAVRAQENACKTCGEVEGKHDYYKHKFIEGLS